MLHQPTDLGLAIKMYYSKTELSANDIKELFGVTSGTTVSRLKKMAREEMAKDPQRLPWCGSCVLTEAAYRAWGLDIDDLERRRAKLMKLKLIKEEI